MSSLINQAKDLQQVIDNGIEITKNIDEAIKIGKQLEDPNIYLSKIDMQSAIIIFLNLVVLFIKNYKGIELEIKDEDIILISNIVIPIFQGLSFYVVYYHNRIKNKIIAASSAFLSIKK